MAICNSWRVVGIGSWNSGGFATEIATYGFTGVADDAGALTPLAIDRVLPTFDADPSGLSGTTTNTTVNYGSIGPGAWTATHQGVIAEAMRTHLGAFVSYQSTAFSWKEIRVSAILATGEVLNGASVFTLNTPLVGTSSANNLPPQNAVVASLRTGGRGPKNRGRIYIPIHAATSIVAFEVSAGLQTAMRSATKTYLDAINAETPDIRSGVVSRLYGTFSNINNVKSGNFVDTQRRRRNGLKETYLTTAVTT